MQKTIGLIKEGKIPADSRVAFTPSQIAELLQLGWDIKIESSKKRCYTDQEYASIGAQVLEDVSQQDILIGIKEVPKDKLVNGKTYFFFSHTIKEQEHNRSLLQTILTKKITLIDYEVLTESNGERLIAFGNWAGMVGAHNALWTYGKRTNAFSLPRLKDLEHYSDVLSFYKNTNLPPIKIVLTGKGRVASGAKQVLDDMQIKQVTPDEYLTKEFVYPVYTQLDCLDYVLKKDGTSFEKKEYYQFPERFDMAFMKYLKISDIMINGIFWNDKSPAFFSASELSQTRLKLSVIADVTCDIAPNSSIPCTLRATTIDNPVFGYHIHRMEEVDPHQKDVIDIMSIDNLPNELPRDASESFGKAFIKYILPELSKSDSDILKRGTIASNGSLTTNFEYLSNYVAGVKSH